MVTKENLRLSGNYGKKIITHFEPFLVKESETVRIYKSGETALSYYPTKQKILIQGKNSEELYEQLLRKINRYLEQLISMPFEKWYVEQLKIFNDNPNSLGSKNHIFNMEILTLLAAKNEIERFEYAFTFAENFRYNEEDYYLELMYFIFLEERIDLVTEFCDKIKTSRSEMERIRLWEKMYASMYSETREQIQKNKQRIKI